MDNEYYNKKIVLEDNNEYQVIWCINLNQKKYLYLLNYHDYSDIKFVELVDNNTVSLLKDRDEIFSVITTMNKQINMFIK